MSLNDGAASIGVCEIIIVVIVEVIIVVIVVIIIISITIIRRLNDGQRKG